MMPPRAAIILAAPFLSCATAATAAPPAWQGDAGNSRHTAAAPASGQPLTAIRWQTPVDLDPQQTGTELLIHYAPPMITAANTVLLPVKTTATGNWVIDALAGATGAQSWSLSSDYVVPPGASWVPAYPAQLTRQNRLYFAGAGGTVLYRDKPDSKTGATGRVAFYDIAIFNDHTAQMTADVMISTPITSDKAGNIYFGFLTETSNPAKVASGLARIAANGTGTWISAAAASGDKTMTEVPVDCAPALSSNGKLVYTGISNGSSGYIVSLDAATLTPVAKMPLVDPQSGQAAWVTDISSASPTVGPDGDVYFGVLENPFPNHDGRGWMLHFDGALTHLKTPGSFGWDDTASIVPASAIPASAVSGAGRAKPGAYYIMTKYNNYAGVGPLGDGKNRIAILDPTKTQTDEYSQTTVKVMKEVETILGPTPYPGGQPGSVYEWCVNTSVVDAAAGAVFAGSEDGKLYRWDLATNTLTQSLLLNAPKDEAYTPTLIGPDGTVYAINNATLYAVGQ
jgi:hypothetical protein